MKKQLVQIEEYFEGHRDELIEFWRELVNFQAGSREFGRIEELIRLTQKRLTEEGLHCKLVPSGKAPVLVAVDGPEREGKPILFCGHLDTVFSSDTFPDNPFDIRDGVAYGPGALDMKGGVAMMLYIVKALRHVGFDRNPIKIVLCGDEETIHDGSTADEIIRQEAEGCLFALNMEVGRMDNCLSVGRKGALDTVVTVHGRSSHAGNDYHSGRNAVVEMSHKIIALQGITDQLDGVTVSPNVVQGGAVSNIIPDQCRLVVDSRFTRVADLERLKGKISQVCAETCVDGTQTTVDFVNVMPVFERTEENLELLRRANRAAEEYGLPAFGEIVPGGSSDTSYIAMAGVPALCSCGVQGSGAHTKEECAFVETLFQRGKIFAAMIAEFN